MISIIKMASKKYSHAILDNEFFDLCDVLFARLLHVRVKFLFSWIRIHLMFPFIYFVLPPDWVNELGVACFDSLAVYQPLSEVCVARCFDRHVHPMHTCISNLKNVIASSKTRICTLHTNEQRNAWWFPIASRIGSHARRNTCIVPVFFYAKT